jgi:hypothetical protein
MAVKISAENTKKVQREICAFFLLFNKISNHARSPAELKHIIKQRKRNQQGFPQ